MKRIVFLLALLYGATLMAQNKAVAVTEVVDKEDKVSYATEIMVRTMLTAAISMKQGYTAYDRVDLQSIMSEQNFQRTGLVDDATIKRLGEMTGASLILIPEVAMSDDGKIYVAVKMLDVTTAQTLMSTGELMGSSSAEVEEGCRALTAKVLGVRSGTSSTTVGSDEPVTLFGYLRVFPTDIGEFQTLPAQLLYAINKKATYGYDSWRLPTTEELSIMRANSHLIPNFRNVDYLCSDSSVKGFARLVTTELSATEKKEAKEQDEMIRKKAIFNLLGIYYDFNNYIILDTIVVYCCKRHIYALEPIKKPSHLKNFTWRNSGSISLASKCISSIFDPNMGMDPNMGILLSSRESRSEELEPIRGRQANGTFYEQRKDLRLMYSSGHISTMSIYGLIRVDGDGQIHKLPDQQSYTCLCLYVAQIPSEQAIRQEMQKYY